MKGNMQLYRIAGFLLIIGIFFILLIESQTHLEAGNATPSSFVFLPTIINSGKTQTIEDDLVALSDQFEDNLIDDTWIVFNESDFSQEEYGGQLHIIPSYKVVWYRANNGPFLYKLVDGDFKLTVQVITDLSAPLDLSRPYQYAGTMMRDPSSDTTGFENYVFNVVGMHIDELAVETKSTLNDESDVVQDQSWNDGNAELRICRVGADFYLYKRHIGETIWIFDRMFNRPDIGATVQAGIIAYAQNDDPDLDAGFEYVEFSRIQGLGDCTTN